MGIEPDTKDWTWVIERPCPECGFEAGSVAPEQVALLVRENAAEWLRILGRSARLAERPSDERWSALEYACHVRDVFRIYDERLTLLRDEENPTFANWDQDATAVDDRYDEQDPVQVAAELDAAAHALAEQLDEVTGEAWRRTGNRSDGASFTVDTFARYMIHDPIHHLHDVEVGFEALGP